MEASAMDARLYAVEREALTNTVRLSEHEKQCADRYAGLRRDIQRIIGILLWIGGALIAGMAGILVKLMFFPAGG